MIKILFVLTKQDIGGAQKYVADLSEGLDPSLFETETVTGGPDGARWLSNAVHPFLLFFNDWLAIFELRKIFKKKKPDIVHLNNSKAGVIGAVAAKLADKNIKVVFTVHGWVFNPLNYYPFLINIFFILLHRIAARFQDIIINVSEYDRQLSIRRRIAPESKLITIHNGLGVERIGFLERVQARRELLKDSEEKTLESLWVGSVGRLVKEKNYKALVDAATFFQDDNIHFIIIGDGPKRKALASRIASKGLAHRFTLAGVLPDAARYLKALDIFVLPSIKEGLPYTLIEAMAAKVPVVTTGVGGIPEIVEDRGRIISSPDVITLQKAIKETIADPEKAKKRAEAAYQYVKKQLSLERMVRKTKNVYSRMV